MAPDCGMKYLPRAVAFGKMKAMVEGAAIVRRAGSRLAHDPEKLTDFSDKIMRKRKLTLRESPMPYVNETESHRRRPGALEEHPRSAPAQVMQSLIKHLHGFVRDIEPTEAEWATAIDFLTRIGKMCDDKRQEFILFSDVMGVSMLVDCDQPPPRQRRDPDHRRRPVPRRQCAGGRGRRRHGEGRARHSRVSSSARCAISTASRSAAPRSTCGRPTARASTRRSAT